jgi:hypothetical protein
LQTLTKPAKGGGIRHAMARNECSDKEWRDEARRDKARVGKERKGMVKEVDTDGHHFSA